MAVARRCLEYNGEWRQKWIRWILVCQKASGGIYFANFSQHTFHGTNSRYRTNSAILISRSVMESLQLRDITHLTCWTQRDLSGSRHISIYSVSQKKSPPTVFWNFFPNGWEFLIVFLHTYYTIISTLDYKFLFKYLQLWQSYAILSATT